MTTRRNILLFYRLNLGYCPICQKSTLFISLQEWLRDHYKCIRCKSIPRSRALIDVLETHFPRWREEMCIHESSPGGSSSEKNSRECRHYIGTHYFPDVASCRMHLGFRCENLESQTFPDGIFDLVITQDVLEHILHPEKAFFEIARTLKPGGVHLFTVPWYYWKKTEIRAAEKDGEIIHRLPPEYHGNPISRNGSLVVREWGQDMMDFIYRSSGLTTTAVRMFTPHKGIESEFIEVFISQKYS
jgi:SAM-dependent methyltransferase